MTVRVWVRDGVRGRYFNTVNLVNRLASQAANMMARSDLLLPLQRAAV